MNIVCSLVSPQAREEAPSSIQRFISEDQVQEIQTSPVSVNWSVVGGGGGGEVALTLLVHFV